MYILLINMSYKYLYLIQLQYITVQNRVIGLVITRGEALLRSVYFLP